MPRLTDATLRPHQREIMNLGLRSLRESRPLLVHGARGTLKTTSLVLTLWIALRSLAFYYRDIRFVVAMSTYKGLRDTFLAAWNEQVDASEFVYHGTEQTITLTPNGCPMDAPCVIQLKHAGDFKEGLSAERASRNKRGASIHGFYFPQAESIANGFWREINIQVRGEPTPRDPAAPIVPYNIRWYDANPDSPNHWLHGIFLDPKSSDFDERALTRSYPMTPATTIYSPQTIADFRRTWPAFEVARLIEGRWVGAAGAMFHIDEGRHVTDTPLASPRWYLAFDWGYSAGQATLLIAAGDDCVHVVDEHYGQRMRREEHLPLIQAMISRNLMPGDSISGFVADQADPEGNILWYRRALPAQWIATSKERGVGWKKLDYRIKTDNGAGRPRLTFAPRCYQLLQSLRANEWNDDGTDSKENPFDHHADCLRYFVMCAALPDYRT